MTKNEGRKNGVQCHLENEIAKKQGRSFIKNSGPPPGREEKLKKTKQRQMSRGESPTKGRRQETGRVKGAKKRKKRQATAQLI